MTHTEQSLLSQYVRDRNAALFSLDKNKILRFCRHYGITLPAAEDVFWAAVFKSILHITDAPENLKAQAREWLKENGFKEALHADIFERNS